MGMKPVLRSPQYVVALNGDPVSFVSQGRHNVRGRGKVVSVELQWDATRTELERWVGKTVRIDGYRVTIRGVETFCIERQPKGTMVGLLV